MQQCCQMTSRYITLRDTPQQEARKGSHSTQKQHTKTQAFYMKAGGLMQQDLHHNLDIMSSCLSTCEPMQARNTQSSETLQKIAGAYAAGLIDDKQMHDIVRHACPGAGACGGMYTANTMSSAIEALGMSLPYSSSIPAVDPLKMAECRRAGK